MALFTHKAIFNQLTIFEAVPKTSGSGCGKPTFNLLINY